MTSTASCGSTPGSTPGASKPGSVIVSKSAARPAGSMAMNSGAWQTAPSHAGTIPQPGSTPHVSSGRMTLAPKLISRSPKQDSATSGGRSANPPYVAGTDGQDSSPGASHGSPVSLSASATQPNGSTSSMWSAIGATRYHW